MQPTCSCCSMHQGFDSFLSCCLQAHIRLGEVLAPLADEGVLVLGSGMTYHNMRGFNFRGRGGGSAADDSKACAAMLPCILLAAFA